MGTQDANGVIRDTIASRRAWLLYKKVGFLAAGAVLGLSMGFALSALAFPTQLAIFALGGAMLGASASTVVGLHWFIAEEAKLDVDAHQLASRIQGQEFWRGHVEEPSLPLPLSIPRANARGTSQER